MLDKISDAISDISAGKMIIVVDDENRENEGDFVMSAQTCKPSDVNFMITHGRGLVCTPLSQKVASRLELNLMVPQSSDSMQTAFTVSVDAKEDISTGISASDRARCINLLSQTDSTKDDFVTPGHIFPLLAKNEGVLVRPGHTEAAVDLSKLAGKGEVGVICEILNPDGSCARLNDLLILSKKFNLKIISIEDLISYIKEKERKDD